MRRPAAAFATVILLSFSIASAAAEEAARAEAFVRSLYARYQGRESDAGSPTGADAPGIFDPTLLDLIRRDHAAARGETPLLDHDPICDCQDWEGFGGLRVSFRPTGDRTAEATARFRISADQVAVGFKLVQLSAGWRIDDIETKAAPSLKAALMHGLSSHPESAR